MIIKMKLGAAISAALLLFGSFVSQAAAEDCHRGTLDEAYCDRNLDQVADLPLDPKDWVDPKTIHGSLYEEAWDKIPNAEKIKNTLGWQTTSKVDEIIKEVIEYYETN